MNGIPKELLLSVGGALLCAFAVSFLMCPLVKSFAYKIGAIDVPKDNRRMHKSPYRASAASRFSSALS